jgi:molybdopterin molybdotransferase
MIQYSEALEIIARTVEPLAASATAFDQLGQRSTVGDVVSDINVPGFANAAMDGFAVRAADTEDENDAIRLPVQGLVAAGDRPGGEHRIGTAVEIMTGAPIPIGADAVIPYERVENDQSDQQATREITLNQAVTVGDNVRFPGEDFQEGGTVLRNGQRIMPESLMGLAAAGIDQLMTRPAPRIAVLTTGNELTASGTPDRVGIIRDANGPYLSSCVQHLGARLTECDSVSDSPEALENKIQTMQNSADIVLTTGGVSAGRLDCVPDAITRLGGEILFHKVAIRPGKPVLFARLPNGSLLFGLPGNPIAVAACLRFLVIPALRLLQDLPVERNHTARIMENFHKKPGLCFFGKASASIDGNGKLQVRLLPGQESFKINPLLKSNSWAIIPEELEIVKAGDFIQIAPLYPTEFLQ